MPTVEEPYFRKIIVPWYDSYTICIAVLVMMVLTFIFGVLGIIVARSEPSYSSHIWIPCLLILLSSVVMVSVLTRMVRRNPSRPESLLWQ